MKTLIAALAILAPALHAADADRARTLDEIGRIASVMVDGDVCRRIMTPRALEYMSKKDPRDPWVDGDNFAVNKDAFNLTKKTLIRLSRLAGFPCDVNLWMPIPGKPGRIQVLIRNANETSQFWTWGALHQETPPPMARVLAGGARITVAEKPGITSVLAPVYDSLGDIAGLVEVVARDAADPRENVK
ncbi:MAG: hypothetical protein ACM336_06380 [Acidobacteriota bacterium]